MNSYGKYSVPETLTNILELQSELRQKGMLPYGDLLGYNFKIYELDDRYLNTPLDLIPFASPGMDGIHYGFLTDFGSVKDLEDAYIVRVVPMDFDEPVKIVARNLQDFLRLLCFAPASLDILDIYSNEDLCRKVSLEDSTIVMNKDTLKVREIFRKRAHLEPIPDIFNYFLEVSEERVGKIVLATKDGLGVVNKISASTNHKAASLSRYNSLKLYEVQSFFAAATPEAKLGFLRDAQSLGLIYDNEEVKEFLRDELVKLKLLDEAERMMVEV